MKELKEEEPMTVKRIFEGMGWMFAFCAASFLALPSQAADRRWVNPKESIGPQLARLPQWKKELADLEKEEIHMQGLRTWNPRIKVNGTLPSITGYDSLPPEPTVRREFWEKLGAKVDVAR